MERVKLGEICEIVSGSTPKTGVTKYWDGDINWITPAELTDETYIIEESQRKITDVAVQETGLRSFPKGTVILSSRAPIGKVAIAGKEMYCNQGFKNLICSEKIDNRYLYWYLKGHTDYLNSLGRGATFKEISKSIVENIEIPLPSLAEQSNCADVLEKCRNLILTQKTQIKQLDLLIKSRFVEMFGDLVINPYKWPILKVSDVSTLLRSGLSRKLSDEDIGLPVIRSGNIQNGQFVYEDIKYWYKDDPQGSKTEDYVLDDGDILVNFINSPSQIGKTAIYRDTGRNCIYTTNIFRMKLADNCNEYYYNWFAMTDYYYWQLQNIIQPAVNQSSFTTVNFLKINIPLPPIEKQNEFAVFVRKTDKLKAVAQKRLEKIQLLFDSLMQQYFG